MNDKTLFLKNKPEILALNSGATIRINKENKIEQELAELEQELTDAGYEWFINHTVDYPQVEVYEKNKDIVLAIFENIKTQGRYQIFFDGSSGGVGLSEGEEQDVSENDNFNKRRIT